MDPVIFLGEGHRSDTLLDFSVLTRGERVMIQASSGNERDPDRVAETLIIRHSQIRLYENRIHMTRDTGKRKWQKQRQRSRSKGKGKATAYYADYPTHDDYDNDDDAVELADSYQACNDPAGPDSDDGHDVQHGHDDEHDIPVPAKLFTKPTQMKRRNWTRSLFAPTRGTLTSCRILK